MKNNTYKTNRTYGDSSFYKIEDNVPLPYRANRPKYPFHEMKVGQSFFVPKKALESLAPLAYMAGKRMNSKFALRKERNCVRVWKVQNGSKSILEQTAKRGPGRPPGSLNKKGRKSHAYAH